MNHCPESLDKSQVVAESAEISPSSLRPAPSAGAWLPEDCEPGLVSVVLATHNRAALLGETLDSILRQTYERVETVIVDDGSTDATPTVLAEWQARFQSERGWRLECSRQENRGGPAGRNRAARQARGEYLNFFDDDDLLTRDKIASQVAALRASDADVAYGPNYFFRRQGGCYWIAPGMNEQPCRSDQPVMESLLQGWEWALQAALITRRFLRRIGPWDEQLLRGQDLEYKLRILRHVPRLQHVPLGAAYIRRHAGSVSHCGDPAALESLLAGIHLAEQVSLEQLPAGRCAKPLARYWGWHALRFFEQGAASTAQYCLAQALRHDSDFRPEKLGRIDRLAFGIAGLKGVGAWRRTERRLAGALRACGLRAGASRPMKQLPLAPAGVEAR